MTDPWVDDWSAIGTLPLGDVRRGVRLRALVESMCRCPHGAVPQMFAAPAEIKAAYRMLDRADSWRQPMLAALRHGCLARVARCPLVLAVQDTTHLDFTGSPANGDSGFWAHTLLAVAPDGVPLGVLHQHFWQRSPEQSGSRAQRRERPVAEKESQRWIDGLSAVTGDDWPPDTAVIVVADRESDIFELFATPRPAGRDLLIRAAHPRRVAGAAGNLWQAVEAAPVADERTVVLPRRPERATRPATLRLRYAPVTVLPPEHGVRSPDLAPVSLWVVAVDEIAAPPGEKPVSWVLLSTRPVTDAAAGWECVDHYCRRWLIERLHFTLKSGCQIEASQLHDAQALAGLLVLFSFVAWRLLWLTYLARTVGDLPCTVAFTVLEWQVAYRLRYKAKPLPTATPTLREAVACVAQLGGHMGRRGDGPPGVKVLWRGLTRLQTTTEGALLLNPELQDLGKA